MSEIKRIPGKFKSIIVWSPVPLWNSDGIRDAARFDTKTGITTLDPEANVAVLAEELWHIKQQEIKRRLGLPVYERRMGWIAYYADEFGIAPRSRDVAVKLNLDLLDHNLRYLDLLNKFIRSFYRSYTEESLDYFERLRGQKLFDGLAFVIQELYKPGYCAPNNLFWRYSSEDPHQLDLFWERVNKARKGW